MAAMKQHAITNRLGPFATRQGERDQNALQTQHDVSASGPDEITLTLYVVLKGEKHKYEFYPTRAEASDIAFSLSSVLQDSDPATIAREEAFENGDMDPDAVNEANYDGAPEELSDVQRPAWHSPEYGRNPK